ncbi:MAG: hypothetical protein ACLPQY_25680 [Streptosporangiaceae bacterium]
MGQKTVRFSDLSGQLITEDDALARIVVHDHPELGDSPVEFEALTDEAKVIEKAALRVAIVELHVPGEDEPRRVVVDAAAFDALATDTPMNELLIAARPARPARRATKTTSGTASGTSNSTGHSGGGRVNYATLEHAGEPHKGKTTDLEKQLVRDHFDEVNDRLVAQGLRTISLADPEHIERYGLQDLASELMPGQEALPIKELIGERDEDLPLDDIQDDLAS